MQKRGIGNKMKVDIYKYLEKVIDEDGDVIGYRVIKPYVYYSERYKKHVCLKTSDPIYDGATYAIDINSFGWPIHDVLKRDKCFSDGTKCSNFKASMVLRDILRSEGRKVRSKGWFLSTFIFGEVKGLLGIK